MLKILNAIIALLYLQDNIGFESNVGRPGPPGPKGDPGVDGAAGTKGTSKNITLYLLYRNKIINRV